MKSTGAIPKTKQSFKHSKMEDSDGVTESSIPSLGPSKVKISKGKNLKRIELNSSVEIKSSSSEETPPKRKWRNKSSSLMRSDSSSDGSPSSKSMRKMLRNLDFCSVPQLETFNETSGQDLVKYLSKFEYYCQENFKGKRYLWVNELERHLSGRVLEALQSLHQFGDNYDEVKSKLLIWYKDEWEIRKAKARKKCHFCGKFGHLQANCRNRLGSCFGCGERGHFRRDCTNNSNRGRQVSGDSFRRWYSRSQSVSPRGSRNLGHERFRSVDAGSSAQGRTVEMPSNHRPLALTGEC